VQAAVGKFSETEAFGANPGQLRMFVHAPESLPPGPALVVVLHGCGQEAADFADQAGWISLADRLGFVVLAPAQTTANNPGGCFNWFRPADTRRGSGEAASIAQMIAMAVAAYGVDRKRVFVAGLSAGGAMALALLVAYPELFAGGAIIAGVPFGVAGNVVSGLRAMSAPRRRSSAELGDLLRRAAPAEWRPTPRLTVWQGDADKVVNPINADDIMRQWISAAALAPTPRAVSKLAGRTRSVWTTASANGPLLELQIVHGLGHGVPLATTGPAPLGSPAPFMLEAGIGSTAEIASFWGLGPAQAITPSPPEPMAPGTGEPVRQTAEKMGAVARLGRLFATAARKLARGGKPADRDD
jgi:feruloyl esterase